MMKVETRGWPPGWVSYLIVILCLLTGSLNAGPLQKRLTSVVSMVPAITSDTPASPVPTLIAGSTIENLFLELRDTVAQRDQGSDTVRHDYALVCGQDNRKLTQHCQMSRWGYYCTSQGAVYWTGTISKYCDHICRCVDLSASSARCVLPYIIASSCYVTEDGTVFDGQKQVLGHVNQTSTLPNGTFDLTAMSDTKDGVVYDDSGNVIGPTADVVLLANETLDFSQNLPKRDGAIPHNFALVCDTKGGTNLCAKKPFEYYCKDTGALARKGTDVHFCSTYCQCINLAPRRCIDRLVMVQCNVKDGIAQTDNGTVFGHIDDAELLPDGTLDFTHASAKREQSSVYDATGNNPGPASAVAKRDFTAAAHSYALVCGNKKSWTQLCQKSKFGYYCNSSGALRNTGTEQFFCEDVCECIDLEPRPKCILSPFIGVTCLVKDGVAYNDQGQVLGRLSDALVYPNGTVDLRSSAIASRDVGTWALLCSSPHHTRTCHGSPLGYACNKNNITSTARDSVCDWICKCSNTISMYTCISRSNIRTQCHIEDDKVYEINGTLMGDLLGHLDDAVVHQDATIDFFAGTAQAAVPTVVSREVSERVTPSLSDLDILPTRSKRNEDDTMDHWVLYCMNKPHTITCMSPPISYRCHLASVTPGKRNEHDFVCDQICHCISHYPTQICIPTKSYVALCPVLDDVVFDPNGTVLGHSSEAYVHTNGTLDFSQLPAKPEVLPRRSRLFHMQCVTDDGRKNKSLTRYCSDHGYTCARGSTDSLFHLQQGSDYVEQCSSDCHCPSPFVHESTMTISERAWSIKDANITAPPSGVPSQYSDTYQLDCGNRQDGPGFCSGSDLGYFCEENGTVVRSSTDENPGVTWCDFYCKCIFRHPIPCVNEWNIPFCQELTDGTVRDASNLSTVVGTIDSSWMMPNGSLLLDRGMPYRVDLAKLNITQAEEPPAY